MHENSPIPENGMKTRLGKRLKALLQSIDMPSSVVYDLCCDHGAIGRAVLELDISELVVFNDIHPDIMARLGQQLERLQATSYRLETKPAEQVQLAEVSKGCVILAGVGDEQCIEILKALLHQPASKNYTFIISPATKNYFVRRYLHNTAATCLFDKTVTENGRTYEIYGIKKSESPEHPVALFGEGWEVGNRNHQKHLQKLIGFYSAQLKQGSSEEIEFVVHEYKHLLEQIA